MGKRSFKISPFAISIFSAVAATCAAVVFAVNFGKVKIPFEREFFFVCFSVKDSAVSAAAVSDSVSNLGGAGYVLEYGGNYYITISCYYNGNDAENVRQSLLRRGMECSVLAVETNEYILKSGKKELKALYSGNLNTLYSLSEMCYRCANGLDGGELGQTAAREILKAVKNGLDGLKKANVLNCFSKEIDRLSAECEAAGKGYIFSKSMRKLQIAIADTIINIDMY